MKPDQHDYDLLDQYHKGRLTEEEAALLLKHMGDDPEFGDEATAYLELIGTISRYGERQQIKKELDAIHADLEQERTVSPTRVVTPFKRSWRVAAVAASVMVISIMGTWFITRSLQTEQRANYKELRRNVEQIKRSQKQIMENLEPKGSVTAPGKYSGTGFLISTNGYVATSYHVVKEADSVLIENESYGLLKTTVIYSDAQRDISILRIVSPEFKIRKPLPFTISRTEAELGEYVYTLGFPREDIVFGEGSVSASSGFGRNPDAYQISVPVNPGNSGGPLLNSRGDLVGMVSGMQTETLGASFAIKSSQLLNLVSEPAFDSLARPLVLPRENALRNMSRVQQVKKWKEFVFLVRVYNEK